MSILRGRCGTVNYHPVLKLINRLKSFSGVEIDQNHVDKRILGGKGLQYKSKKHNFCPASALRHRCCIDTEVFMWIHSA